MNLSIIIPVGRPQTAEKTIKSVLDQSFLPDDLQIILAGCDLDGLVAHFADCRFQTASLEKRCNPSETRIAGVQEADGEWYLFVDDDIELDRFFLEKLSSIISQGNKFGAVGARLPGRESTYFSRVTDLTNFWSQQSGQSGERDWLYSAVLAMPSSVYHTVGGFDPDFAIGEDVDLTRRVKEAGYGVYYEAGLIGYHNHRRTTLHSAISYFRQNGGLALYQFKSSRHLRVWSAKNILRNSIIGLKNTFTLNRKEVEKLYIYLPGVAMMYFVFYVSLEAHLNRYTTRFIQKGDARDTMDEYTMSSFLKKTIEGKRAGNNIMAMFSFALAYVAENKFFILLLLFLMTVLFLCMA